MNGGCPNCGRQTNEPSSRLIADTCGHKKCRICLLYEEQGCNICEQQQNIFSVTQSIETSLKNDDKLIQDTTVTLLDISASQELIKNVENQGITEELATPYPQDEFDKSEKNGKNQMERKVNDKKERKQKKHVERNHIIVLPGPPLSYKCNVCQKVFNNKKGICYHDVCVTGIRPYQCTTCDRSFVKKSHFEYHVRVHTGYKPFKCELCEKAFPQKNKLNRHMLSHNQEKQFLCPTCGKRYSKKDDLKSHMLIHDGLMPHTCNFCGKSFRIKTSLKRHMFVHSNERPHRCDYCGKSFKDKSLLVRHKRIHGKDRPYSCAHCNKVFLSKSELRRHINIHSDVKPFCCNICQTVFRRKDNLNRHMRHHHIQLSSKDNKLTIDINNKEPSKSLNNNNKKKIPKNKLNLNNNNDTNSSNKLLTVKKSDKVELTLNDKPANMIVDNNSSNNSHVNVVIEVNKTPVIIKQPPRELSNAVSVINGPISSRSRYNEERNDISKFLTYREPISRDEAVVINQRIEEKLYSDEKNHSLKNYRQHSSQIESHLPPLKYNSIKTLVEKKQLDSNFLPPNDSNLTELKSATATSYNTVQINDQDKIIANNVNGIIYPNNNSSNQPIIDAKNCVSTITKNIIHISNNNNNNNNNDDNQKTHWRRRTAEILKPNLHSNLFLDKKSI